MRWAVSGLKMPEFYDVYVKYILSYMDELFNGLSLVVVKDSNKVVWLIAMMFNF